MHVLMDGCSQVLVAVHRIVLFDLTLEDDRQVDERRSKARRHLSVLKLGVHRFLAMRAKRCHVVYNDVFRFLRCCCIGQGTF